MLVSFIKRFHSNVRSRAAPEYSKHSISSIHFHFRSSSQVIFGFCEVANGHFCCSPRWQTCRQQLLPADSRRVGSTDNSSWLGGTLHRCSLPTACFFNVKSVAVVLEYPCTRSSTRVENYSVAHH